MSNTFWPEFFRTATPIVTTTIVLMRMLKTEFTKDESSKLKHIFFIVCLIYLPFSMIPLALRLSYVFLSLFAALFYYFKLNINQSFWSSIIVMGITMIAEIPTLLIWIPIVLSFVPLTYSTVPYILVYSLFFVLNIWIILFFFTKHIHRFIKNKALLKQHQITAPLVLIVLIAVLSLFIALYMEDFFALGINRFFTTLFLLGIIIVAGSFTYFANAYLIKTNEMKALSVRLNQMESSLRLNKSNAMFEKSMEYDLSHSEVGKQITGMYVIDRLIYSGKNSQIYLMKKPNSNALYTLKAIQITDEIQYRFDSLLNMKHPNIANIHEFFVGEHFYYILKPYIAGQTLYEQIVQNGPLPMKKAVHVIDQIVNALDYLHNRKDPIVFRDLKPSNIIIDDTDHITLIDIESIRIKKVEQDSDTFFVGTKGYTPPEQYGYSQSTPQSDIYALGATIFFILTGQTPDVKILETADTINKPWLNIVKKCMAFNPKDRYEQASILMNDLRTLKD